MPRLRALALLSGGALHGVDGQGDAVRRGVGIVVGEDCGQGAVEGCAELVGITSDLGEEQAALYGCERALSERGGVSARS